MSSVFICETVYKDDMRQLKRYKVPCKILSHDVWYYTVQFETKEDHKRALELIKL